MCNPKLSPQRSGRTWLILKQGSSTGCYKTFKKRGPWEEHWCEAKKNAEERRSLTQSFSLFPGPTYHNVSASFESQSFMEAKASLSPFDSLELLVSKSKIHWRIIDFYIHFVWLHLFYIHFVWLARI